MSVIPHAETKATVIEFEAAVPSESERLMAEMERQADLEAQRLEEMMRDTDHTRGDAEAYR